MLQGEQSNWEMMKDALGKGGANEDAEKVVLRDW